MAKVLVVTERFAPEDFLVNDLVRSFRDRGIPVEVLTQVPSYPADRLFPGYRNRFFQIRRWEGIRVHRFFTILGYKQNVIIKILNYLSFALFTTLFALFFHRRYDSVLFVHTGPLTMATSNLVFGRFARSYIWTQDVWPDTVYAYGFRKSRINRFLLDLLVKSIYRPFSKIFVSSPGFVDSLSSYVRRGTHRGERQEIRYIPQWFQGSAERVAPEQGALKQGAQEQKPCEVDPYRGAGVQPGPGIESGSWQGESGDREPGEGSLRGDGLFHVVFAGNIGTVQNLEILIDAFTALPDDFRLHLVGDGSRLEALKERAAGMAGDGGSAGKIRFHGRIPFSDVGPYLACADVLVISLLNRPILNKTLPAKFQAYLSYGKPLLGVLNGVVADYITAYHLGAVADPDDVESVRTALKKLRSLSQEERDAIAAAATRIVQTEFNREQIIAELGSGVHQFTFS
jgi:glycosyltransferase involved in cell wall biosynthesis